jgi:hypothetical protein
MAVERGDSFFKYDESSPGPWGLSRNSPGVSVVSLESSTQ